MSKTYELRTRLTLDQVDLMRVALKRMIDASGMDLAGAQDARDLADQLTPPAAKKELRRQAMRKHLASGLDPAEVAALFGVHVRTVQRLQQTPGD